MIERDRMAEPLERPAGFQSWSNLAFVHWRVPIQALRDVVPQPLSLDTWEDQAWLGMVAFEMSRIRPWWSPALPYLSAFPETNLRTYVHLDGAGPGVWFFSLDASRWLAVQAARWGWGLNYCWSRMRVQRRYSSVVDSPQAPSDSKVLLATPHQTDCVLSEVDYHSQRVWGQPAGVDLQLSIAGQQQPRTAEPNSLEYFLCERYLLYTMSAKRQLFKARVHHAPYPLLDAKVEACRQNLTETIGCRVDQIEHVIFSPGVEVRVYSLQSLP